MKPQIYKIIGAVIVLISIILVIIEPHILSDIPLMLTGNDSYGLLASFGVIALFITGIIHLLFGIGKLKTNKLSDWSIKLMMLSVIIGVGGSLIIFLVLTLSRSDPMGFILILPFVYLAGLLVIISCILSVISIFKKK